MLPENMDHAMSATMAPIIATIVPVFMGFTSREVFPHRGVVMLENYGHGGVAKYGGAA